MKCKQRWAFYTWEMDCHDGHCENVFTRASGSCHVWPVTAFENAAKRLGYTHFCKDQTLIGGYFANDDGDCLICMPADFDPVEWYNLS